MVFPPMPPPERRGRDSAPVCAGHDGQKGYVNCPAGPPSADRPEIHRGADEMHMRTKALVLRAVDYKESDKILTLLTQESGKLTASARGCRKKGSPVGRRGPAAGLVGPGAVWSTRAAGP